jgi:hypothetical protein
VVRARDDVVAHIARWVVIIVASDVFLTVVVVVVVVEIEMLEGAFEAWL